MAELKAESSRSYLGFFWWILEPALYMVAFYIVFALVFQRGGPGFIPFLLCGLVVWKWFGSVVSGSANVILSSSALIRQVYIPKYLLP
ncbi:MAG: ABC transporter permease, partial [Porticoccus sp.]|nr:ABC transporter permease [Porticoccus sp.]